MDSIIPVAATFLPAAIHSQLIEHVVDTVIGFGDDIGQLRIFRQQCKSG